MINLEEEARKRRERLKAKFSTAEEKDVNLTVKDVEVAPVIVRKQEEVEINRDDEFTVPDDEVLLDSSGAEILGMDSKIPDTLEAQAKALLLPQNSSTEDADFAGGRNSDLKREYERRKALLDKQTKKSINELVRARLSSNSEKSVEEEQ